MNQRGVSGTKGSIHVGFHSIILFLIVIVLAGSAHFVEGSLRSTAVSSADQPENTLPPPMIVSGRVYFDTDEPVAGARVVARVVPPMVDGGQIFLPAVIRDSGSSGSERLASSDMAPPPPPVNVTFTDANGNFSVPLPYLPGRVLIKILYTSEGLPDAENSRWKDVGGLALDMGLIVLPNPQGAEIALSNGSGQNQDGSIQVQNMPGEVAGLYGRAYDPGQDADAFPGEFTENGKIPLNSSLFLWMEGLDANGDPVDDLSQAATIRSRVPPSQWIDLEDIEPESGQIEVPIYTYDETSDMWDETGIGWLEDEGGNVIAEEEQEAILDGSYSGDIYAVYTTGHFSWMNVDYSYIGPWTLSHMQEDKRNNSCLYDAVSLAETIALSDQGRAAFSRYNKPGANVEEEFADGEGPEIRNADFEKFCSDPSSCKKYYALYFGNEYTMEYGGKAYQGNDRDFYLNERMWDKCGENATSSEEKYSTLIMARSILHETAHWKWDVYHEDGWREELEPNGEAGYDLDNEIFGGVIGYDPDDPNALPWIREPWFDGFTRDRLLTDTEINDWLNPTTWERMPKHDSPSATREVPNAQDKLEITIALDKAAYDLGEALGLQITYQNISEGDIQVMDRLDLEGVPLAFMIYHEAAATRVPFRGPMGAHIFEMGGDFVTLKSGDKLVKELTLSTVENGEPYYDITQSGTYTITAYYSGLWAPGETWSNSLSFVMNAGGGVSGTVTDRQSSNPIAGATVMALQEDLLEKSAITNARGEYAISDLISGTYTIEASAPGYARGIVEDVQLNSQQNTVIDFCLGLPEAIAFGEAVTGTIMSAGDTLSYLFSGSSGDRVLVRLAATGGGLDPAFAVWRPDGSTLCEEKTGGTLAQELCTLDASGDHTIVVSDYNGLATGAFGLYVQSTVAPASSTAIAFGNTLTGTIAIGAEMHAYSFSASTGDKILIRMADSGGSLGSRFFVYRPDGSELCKEGTYYELVETLCLLDASSSYTILAGDYTGSETGDYGLHIQRTNNPSGAASISFGTTKSGQISLPTEMDAYTFSGTAGDYVMVRMSVTSGDLASRFYVYKPDGSELCNQASLGGTAEESCTLPVSGTYTILVGDYWTGTGSGQYELYIAR